MIDKICFYLLYYKRTLFLRQITWFVCSGQSLLLPQFVGGRRWMRYEGKSISSFYLCGHRTVHVPYKCAMTARLRPEAVIDLQMTKRWLTVEQCPPFLCLLYTCGSAFVKVGPLFWQLFVKVNSCWVWNLTLQTSVWKLNLQILNYYSHKEKPTQ